ncbi:MAG: alpha-mannosidase, partial [Sedimentisphaerales bacterium]|nr:alpha-mannosidase [Sedimentisphaerales bacterium]
MNKFLKRLKTPGKKLKRCCFLALALPSACIGQTTYDLANEKVLFVVATAHLDTQWRWTIQKSIDEYLKKTLDDNFTLLEKYPDYTFNFEGSFRYMLMKEYYPERYARMSDYIAQGRWHVAGSTVEQGDMNIVSPESLIRQTLLGNNYFEDEFGKRSTDIYLPDCFGFSYSMPTWMAHCGLNGFSTAKLAWGSSVGIPFDIGVWKGPDGSSVIAALNPGAYGSNIENDLSKDTKWIDRINALGEKTGVYAGFKYFGVGDTGGAPSDDSCKWLTTAMADTSTIKVVSAGTDDLYNSITPEQKSALPVYDSELLMSKHGVGCYTAQAALKRWNRQNELLADSAERVAAFADILNAVEYPKQTFNEAWTRFLWHSFHDDLTGTSIPEAYHYSWNDEIISQNQFTSILTNSVASLAPALNTKVKGTPIITYNPLAINRTGIIEATVSYDKKIPDNIRVFDGKTELPAQIIARNDKSLSIAFIGTVPSVGIKVFDVQAGNKPCQIASGISISANTLENSALRVTIDPEGNISSIFDKINNREVLSDTCRLELLDNYSEEWPAWEINHKDVAAKPYAFVRDAVKIEIAENGPARAALLISRKYGDSTFLQKVSLSASGSDSQRVTIENLIDWRTRNTLLKASFPLTAANEKATYDLGMGTIQRKNNTEKLFEVPAQQWADITTPDSDYGVSIFSDSRYGWDKPSDNTMRLTLMHSPRVKARYMHGSSQDMGQHKFTYAIAPHAGNWNTAQIPQNAAGMNQPIMAFQTDKHTSALTIGSELSLVQVSDSQALVKAVKKAQRSNELIVRVQELYGQNTGDLTLSAFGKIKSAAIVDGCERYISDAKLADGKVVFRLKPYQPMTFALTLEEPAISLPQIKQNPVSLSYNLDAFSYDTNRSDGNFYNQVTYPAELLSKEIIVTGITFITGDITDGKLNALACNGQTIELSNAGYDSIYLLAAARGGDT